MSFFTDAKIGTRIAASLVAPIAGLLIFSGVNLWEKHTEVRNLERVEALAQLAPTISALVHEMQKERGTSAGFIGSKGTKFADALPKQRQDTNARRKVMNAALDAFPTETYSPSFQSKLQSARTALSELDGKRGEIDTFALTVSQMAQYYTPTILKFLSAVEEMAVLSTDALVTQHIAAYTSFMQAKERAGVERAMGASGFGSGTFQPAIFNNFVGLIAQQKAFMSQFQIYATPEEKEDLKRVSKDPAFAEVERMRKVAIASPSTGDLGGIDGPTWFATITKKINLLKDVEDHLAKDLGTVAEHDRAIANNEFRLIAIATVILIAITAVLVITIVRGITGPIGGMTRAMAALAGGDKTIEIPGVGRGDEIGGMAEAVQVFKDNMIKSDEMAEREAWEQKVRDFRQTAVMRMIAGFKRTVVSMLDQVGQSSSDMEGASTEMKNVADETNQRSITVAAAAEEASTNVEAVASAAEELSSSINEISRQVAQSTQISSQAVTETERANEQVQGLSNAALKIGEVVSLISDIAEQTNLLALNATIEAARAGDAGKGFAVVASEVKNLANQTAKATEEISAQIGSVQGATQDAVDAIEGIGTTIGQVNEIAAAIAAAVEEQGAATQEIARNVEQAASGTQDVSSNIITVKSSAEQTLDTADSVNQVSTKLSVLAGDLRTQIEKFLSGIE